MKFITFRWNDAEHLGVVTADEKEFVDLSEAGVSSGMLDLIERFDSLREPIARLIASGKRGAMSGLEILAPIPAPRRNIFCVGKNYHEHASEFGSSGFDSGSVGGSEIPEYPIIFSKPAASVVGPNAGIA